MQNNLDVISQLFQLKLPHLNFAIRCVTDRLYPSGDVAQIVMSWPVRVTCHRGQVNPHQSLPRDFITRFLCTSPPWHILHNVHHLFTNFCTMTLAKYSEKWYIYLYSVSFLDILKSDFVIPSCGLLRIKGMGHYIDWFDITEYIQLTLYMMYEVNKEHDKLFWCIDDDGGGKTNFQAYSGLKLADPSFFVFQCCSGFEQTSFLRWVCPAFLDARVFIKVGIVLWYRSLRIDVGSYSNV